VSLVLLLRVGVDQDVVEIDDAALIEEVRQGRIDVALEDGGGIGKPERYDSVLKVAVTGPKCRFPLIALLDSDPMVGIP
jgi:hypothetical protein